MSTQGGSKSKSRLFSLPTPLLLRNHRVTEPPGGGHSTTSAAAPVTSILALFTIPIEQPIPQRPNPKQMDSEATTPMTIRSDGEEEQKSDREQDAARERVPHAEKTLVRWGHFGSHRLQVRIHGGQERGAGRGTGAPGLFEKRPEGQRFQERLGRAAIRGAERFTRGPELSAYTRLLPLQYEVGLPNGFPVIVDRGRVTRKLWGGEERESQGRLGCK